MKVHLPSQPVAGGVGATGTPGSQVGAVPLLVVRRRDRDVHQQPAAGLGVLCQITQGLGQTGGGFALLFGVTEPFDKAKLDQLYPGGRADYLAKFDASLARAPQTEIVRYFDGTLTLVELDELSDAFAVALTDRGFAHGDRLATYLQNIPQALIAVVGTWKAGGIVVSINPMSRQRELTTLLTDCGATALVAQDDLYQQVAAEVVPNTSVRYWSNMRNRFAPMKPLAPVMKTRSKVIVTLWRIGASAAVRARC